MYPVHPHAPQPSFLPYHPALQAPSAARTAPVVGVLVAMVLMAALGGLFVTCGVAVGVLTHGAHGAQHGASDEASARESSDGSETETPGEPLGDIAR